MNSLTFREYFDSLSKTSKHNEKLNLALRERFNIDPDILFGRFRGIVTGSFNPSILLDEMYENSDVDIYVLIDKHRHKPYPLELPDNDIDRYIIEELHGVYYGASDYYDNSYKYLTPKGIINIIILTQKSLDYHEKSSVQEYIASISDLDICSSTYDGTELIYPENLFEKKINVINRHLGNYDENNKSYLKDIKYYIGRNTYILSQKYLRTSDNSLICRLLRITKYVVDRNFRVYDEGTIIDLSVYQHLMDAYKKYKEINKTHIEVNHKLIFYTIKKILDNESLPEPIHYEYYLGNCLRIQGTQTCNYNSYHWTNHLTRENNKWIEGWMELFEKSEFVDKELQIGPINPGNKSKYSVIFNSSHHFYNERNDNNCYFCSDGVNYYKLIYDIERNLLNKHNVPKWTLEECSTRQQLMKQQYELENSMFDFSSNELTLDIYFSKQEQVRELHEQVRKLQERVRDIQYDTEFPPL
jgi:hypothetical protein